MKKIAKVAVITRTKDRPLFLRRAVSSVLNQTYCDWVHVIVNDGGCRDTIDWLLKEFEGEYNGRLIVIHHDTSMGMQVASNAGISGSNSEYLLIHDDDDTLEPDFLLENAGFLESCGTESATQGVVSQVTQIIEEVDVNGRILTLERKPYYYLNYVNIQEMLERNLFPPIAFLYRRRIHEEIGLFRQEFDVLGDHDFNIRFLQKYDIGLLDKPLANYHWRYKTFGNTVTAGVTRHRDMLNRLKNAYFREHLEKHTATTLEKIEWPPEPFYEEPEYTPRRDALENPLSLASAVSSFSSIEVLSLDVFDTALRRGCGNPADVFYLLEQRIADEGILPKRPYALLRKVSESIARQKSTTEDISFDEIYAEFGLILGLDEKTTKQIQQLELKIESSLLCTDPHVVSLYKIARNEGKRVIFLSDMYLPEKVISTFLEEAGYDDPELFVSSQSGLTKASGGLYVKVLKLLGVDAKNVLHVGDQYHSDVLMARKNGIAALHYNRKYFCVPFADQVKSPYGYVDGDVLSHRFFGVTRYRMLSAGKYTDSVESRNRELFLQNIGYELLGPMCFAFVQWAVKNAILDGKKRLLLLSRDGYYWKKTLDLIARHSALPVSYEYIYGSRRLFQYASFEGLDADALEFLSTPNPGLKVCDFLQRAGLDWKLYAEQIKLVGFTDPEEVITNDLGGSFLMDRHAFMLHELFVLLESDLKEIFSSSRQKLRSYLDEMKYDSATCAVLDIGWRGSTAMSLLDLYKAQATKNQIDVYYFGTWKEAKGPIDAGAGIRSYFMHLSEPEDNFRLLTESINLIEMLMSAPHPTVIDINRGADGEWLPVFDINSETGFSENDHAAIWGSAEQCIRDLLRSGMPSFSGGDGIMYLKYALQRILREPTPDEVKFLSSLRHSEGFGAEIGRNLVSEIAESNLKADDLVRLYHSSNWKKGFLTTLSDEQITIIEDRCFPRRPKSYEELVNGTKWLQGQLDAIWEKSNKLSSDLKWQKEQADQHWVESQKFKSDLEWQRSQTDRYWQETVDLNNKLDVLSKELNSKTESLAGVNKELVSVSEEHAKCNAILEEAKLEMERNQLKLSTLMEALDSTRKQCETFEDARRDTQQAMSLVQSLLDEEKLANTGLREEIDVAENRIKELSLALSDPIKAWKYIFRNKKHTDKL